MNQMSLVDMICFQILVVYSKTGVTLLLNGNKTIIDCVFRRIMLLRDQKRCAKNIIENIHTQLIHNYDLEQSHFKFLDEGSKHTEKCHIYV